MPKKIEIEPGDCVDKIAIQEFVSSDTIWKADENKDLREKRKNRNVLLHKSANGPGDMLHVPDPVPVWYDKKETTRTHIFKRILPTREFRFQVALGEPLKNYKYKLEIDGADVKTEVDSTDATWITCRISPRAAKAVITLYYAQGELLKPEVKKEHRYEIDLGYLRPVDTPEGQEDRLRNLGFFALLPDGKEPTFEQALLLFQSSYGIDPKDGNAPTDTIQLLKELTGDPDKDDI